jgi:hypothetical protein
MPSYATFADWVGLATDNPEVSADAQDRVERVLERASRDLDAHLGWPAPATDTLRIDTGTLTPYQVAALKRATCEQATYRLQRGEAEMAVDQDGLASVAGISFSSMPPPRLGPAVGEALADAGLLRRSGLAEVPEEEPA